MNSKRIAWIFALLTALALAACGAEGALPTEDASSGMGETEGEGLSVRFGEVEIPASAEEADLSGVNIKELIEDGLDLDAALEALPKLKKLTLIDCGLSNDEYAAFQDAHPDIRMIWDIVLDHWTIRTDRVAFSTMKSTDQTFFLHDEDAKYFKYCTDMEALDLGHNRLTNVEFLQYMPKLKILILVDNIRYIEGGHVYYINDLSPVANCPELKYLEFFCNGVSDISFLKGLTKIEHLNISYNPIHDDQMQYLYGFPKLKRLWMEHTRASYGAFQNLQANYPNAQLIYYGEGSIDHGWREIKTYFNMRDCFNNNYINEEFED